jgi:predicted transcriptional regulator
MSTTTIRISPSTRRKLSKLKASSQETYDDLINKLIALVPDGDDEGPYTQAFRRGLLQARLEIKEGRVVSYEELKRRLGV